MQNNPLSVRKVLAENKIRPSKRRGQNFIVDERIVEKQAAYAELRASDLVYEIGTGLGALTAAIAGRGSRLVSIEIDERLLRLASGSFGDQRNVSLLRADALSFEMKGISKVVSNIPYNLSSLLTFRILELGFDVAILAYQIDFAERMVAQPGSKEYSRLSVNVYYRADVEILDRIPRHSFFPMPKVDSAIVRLEHKKPPFSVKNERFFFGILREFFPYRNQMLRKVLRRFLIRNSYPDPDAVKIIRDAAIEDDRIRNIQPESFGRLSNLLLEMTRR